MLLEGWKKSCPLRTTKAVLRTTTIGLTERDLKSVLKQAITCCLQKCVGVGESYIKVVIHDGRADRRHCKSMRSLPFRMLRFGMASSPGYLARHCRQTLGIWRRRLVATTTTTNTTDTVDSHASSPKSLPLAGAGKKPKHP